MPEPENTMPVAPDCEHPIVLEDACQLTEAVSIEQCLKYLGVEALNSGMNFVAFLIGVAADAVGDVIAASKELASTSDITDVKGAIGSSGVSGVLRTAEMFSMSKEDEK